MIFDKYERTNSLFKQPSSGGLHELTADHSATAPPEDGGHLLRDYRVSVHSQTVCEMPLRSEFLSDTGLRIMLVIRDLLSQKSFDVE